jgi:DNA-binding MarR family transcriptional regulator
MTVRISTADYRALAALRYRMRLFLQEGDAAARRVGLEPQQYLLLLAVRGLPDGAEATVQTLAERLTLKHNSTVELIDRLETRGYVRRSRSRSHNDRRWVMVELLPRGEKLVEQVARQRLTELRAGGIGLAHALDALLERQPKSPDWNKPRLNRSALTKRKLNKRRLNKRLNKGPRRDPAQRDQARHNNQNQTKRRGNKRER